MQVIIKPLIVVMDSCYYLCKNYGLAIILFTFISKVVLLPLSIWLQYNSIKMVKMQPELNYAKVKYYGDKERIAEEQSVIYKKYKFNPFITLIPTIIQLLLLMGVIEVIKNGIGNPDIDMMFMGFSLSVIPSKIGGWYLLSPIAAALSSLIMCICQNKSNVIQVEQSKWNQTLMLVLSVGLSLYLGFFVSVGVALYWILSNIMAIAQLYILNYFINPKKYVDYEKLEESRKALKELDNIGNHSKRKTAKDKEIIKREKADYKRFFSVTNKHLVFYSESNGFYKYYAGLIEYLLKKTNIIIHYITSDPDDNIFVMAQKEPRIRAYYIGERRLITLMMKMDADIVAMTMPDLELFHIKRSYVRDDIEYLYIQHGTGSLNLLLRKGALNYYDTIFSADKTQTDEIRAIEKLYGLKAKKIVECGYFTLDEMIEKYNKMNISSDPNQQKMILIAPSWQKDNIIDSCLEELLNYIGELEYLIIVRPHPQHVRYRLDILKQLKEKYASKENIEFQLDFSATDTVWKADLLITDWSDISSEYAYCTHNPVLFIDTPMKIMNPDYDKIDVIPNIIDIREVFGRSISPKELDKAPELINYLLKNRDIFANNIEEYAEKELYNVGNSAEVAGKYVVDRLKEKAKERQELR